MRRFRIGRYGDSLDVLSQRLLVAGMMAVLLGGCQGAPQLRLADGRELPVPQRKHFRDGAMQARAQQGVAVPGPRSDAPGEWTRFQIERRVPAGEDAIPMRALADARKQRETLPQYSLRLDRTFKSAPDAMQKAAAAWEWLGPANIAGRGRTLVFDPRNPQRMYTAGVSGGVWRSVDGGNSWSGLSDGAENINIGVLAIDPVQADTIYAGTGELYRNSERPYSAMWGQGILRSRDGGQSFQQLLVTANDDFRYVADIVISPNDHNRVYAATNSGVWLSRDGGASFERLLRPADGNDALRYEGCTDLQLLPGDGADQLLATCSSRSVSDRYWLPNSVTPPACGGPCPAAIFHTPDAAGAGAWTQVLSEPGMGRTSMAIAASNPQVVYAVSTSILPGFDRNGDGFGDYENGLHALFRSTDGGLTWQPRLRNSSSDALSTYVFAYADGMEAPRCGFGGFNNYSAGWYNQAIAVDPLNPDIVWVAGMDIYRSSDGGASFGKASYNFLRGMDPSGIHADMHALVFDPGYDGGGNQRLWAVTDGGVWLTEQALGAVSGGILSACRPLPGSLGWRELNNGLGTVQYYSGAVSPDGQRYVAGAQDNGTHLNDHARGASGWQHIFGGDGAEVAIDPTNPQRFFVSYQYVNIHRTEDGGRTFTRATNGLNDTPIFILPYVMDPSQPSRLWAGATRVWTTSNSGGLWRAASARFGASFDDRVSAIAVSPVNPNRVLAANRRGIFRNDAAQLADGSTVWSSVSPRPGWVSSLRFDPVDDRIVYATYSTFGGDHVWKSTDGGSQWLPIDGAPGARLPDIAVHTLAIDPTDRDRLIVGTDLGIFVSLDGGGHWASENSGFANVIVERLVTTPGINGQPPMLYAFTYGRGAWRVPLAQLTGQGDYRIGAELSGSFYDPDLSGQGWVLESLELDGVRWLAATWYSYVDGEQVWLLGLAPANGNRVEIPMRAYRGGDFPPRFVPDEVSNSAWGTLSLRFDSSDSGTAQWSPTAPGFNSGSARLQRLTRPGTRTDPSTLSACHSGSWFQPGQGGHGLQVGVLDDDQGGQLMFAIWFHYLGGKPGWLLGVGPVRGDHADLEMQLTAGADFPPEFESGDVQFTDWGQLRFSVRGADHARIDWSSVLPGYGEGSLELQRLTTLAGLACGAP